ncbi:hypothetical protein SAMN05216376_10366 [Mameliella alba]|uniref:hypothetical protein n=1 Tax=Mameliella alba TaxID=561184 RepID=UPI00087F085E|nr:hypothetical protein [Mameliella alba]PTR41053.1 hypothetical protein LX94_01508 [Mameliella alba]GGF48430.1 hypothetical protein GCM10011319_07640 [Mameliella alba]SDC55507.1 hypothetical protein SAMN05216376_10366 [Mameliella alba]
MKKLIATGAALMAAAPAMSHPGSHMHPHGAESWLSLLPAVALIVVAGLIAWGRR